MTKLEAVNQVLRATGHYSARALDTGGNSNTAEVERELDTQSKTLQSNTGWVFNFAKDVTLAPVATVIAAPAGMITITPRDSGISLVVRSGNLFDAYRNSGVFASSIAVSYTFLCAWLDIPEPVQQHIVALAAEASNDQRGKPEMARPLREKVNITRKVALETNASTDNTNILATRDARMVTGNRRTFTSGF